MVIIWPWSTRQTSNFRVSFRHWISTTASLEAKPFICLQRSLIFKWFVNGQIILAYFLSAVTLTTLWPMYYRWLVAPTDLFWMTPERLWFSAKHQRKSISRSSCMNRFPLRWDQRSVFEETMGNRNHVSHGWLLPRKYAVVEMKVVGISSLEVKSS